LHAAIVGAATLVADCAGLAACAVPIANAKAAAKAKLVTMIAGLFDALMIPAFINTSSLAFTAADRTLKSQTDCEDDVDKTAACRTPRGLMVPGQHTSLLDLLIMIVSC
jgi:hypothetical protein